MLLLIAVGHLANGQRYGYNIEEQGWLSRISYSEAGLLFAFDPSAESSFA